MPIPTIKPGEDKQEFIQRCMADSVMKSEYPDTKQRYSICTLQAKRR